MSTTTTIYDRKTEIPLLRHTVKRSLTAEDRGRFRDELADDHRAEFGWEGPVAVDLWVE